MTSSIKRTKALFDACLIAAEQKIKHYEIASYGTLHAYAKTIGEVKATNLLALNLDEEKSRCNTN
jgi:ferritin-like metal-binding protein YciE